MDCFAGGRGVVRGGVGGGGEEGEAPGTGGEERKAVDSLASLPPHTAVLPCQGAFAHTILAIHDSGADRRRCLNSPGITTRAGVRRDDAKLPETPQDVRVRPSSLASGPLAISLSLNQRTIADAARHWDR